MSLAQIESNRPGEDRYAVIIKPAIKGYIVIDGHGGYLAADIASSFILDTIVRSIEKLESKDRLKTEIVSKIIEDTIISCDDIILKKALEYQSIGKFANTKDFGRAGACLAVILIVVDTLYIANVGDCRAVLIQKCDNCHTAVKTKKRNRSIDNSTNQREEDELDNCTMTDMDDMNTMITNEDLGTQSSNDSDNEMKKQFEADTLEDQSDNKENSYDTNLDFEIYDSLLSDQKNTAQGCDQKNSIKNQKVRQDVGGDCFSYKSKSLKIKGVTTDHCCAIDAEREFITKNNKDPQPLRQSENDARMYGSRAPMRVAGSLAVTRALGDGYLKISDLSSTMYKDYVPYITCRPTIHVRKLVPSDACLILASDGLWNYLSAKDSVGVLKSVINEDLVDNCRDALYLTSHEPPPSHSLTNNIAGYVPAKGQQLETNKYYTDGLASKLIEKCLSNAAAQYSLPVSELKNMSLGSSRRDYIDDITVIALRL